MRDRGSGVDTLIMAFVTSITVALEELAVLVRDPVQKKYNVGYTLLELGRRATAKMELKGAALKPMENWMEKIGETVLLDVRSNN